MDECSAHVRFWGVKRTSLVATHMSAFEPKRTSSACDDLDNKTRMLRRRGNADSGAAPREQLKKGPPQGQFHFGTAL